MPYTVYKNNVNEINDIHVSDEILKYLTIAAASI